MAKKIILGVVAALVLLLGFVATRDGHFNYERSGVINAPAAKIFPYISDFKLGSEWSPYEKKDLQIKKSYFGQTGQVGSGMEFAGNHEVGAGRLEMTGIALNQSVDIRLTMLKPFKGENMVHYKLAPEGTGTRFTWSMDGDGGFMGKLMTVLIDCEKMVAGDFEKGIENLKVLIEAQK